MPPRIPTASSLDFPLLALARLCLHDPPSTSTACIRRGIRSVAGPWRRNRYNEGPSLKILRASQEAVRLRRLKTTPLRTGVIGTKKGMTAIFDAQGKRHACTVVQLDRVQVVAHRTLSKNGYFAVQVGSGWQAPARQTRPMLGHYASANVSPKRHLSEFRVQTAQGLAPVGTWLSPSWFQPGQFVDARANCKGKGFAGGMKRHGMSGQPASHGNSLSHRVMGSAGQSQGGGSRVLPGKRMPGRMGGQQVTIKNIKVVSVDDENGLILLQGCISGPRGGLVQLQDAQRKPWPDLPPGGFIEAGSSRTGKSEATTTATPAATATAAA